MSFSFGSKTVREKKTGKSHKSLDGLVPNRFGTIHRNHKVNFDADQRYDEDITFVTRNNYSTSGLSGDSNNNAEFGGSGNRFNTDRVVNGLVINRFQRKVATDQSPLYDLPKSDDWGNMQSMQTTSSYRHGAPEKRAPEFMSLEETGEGGWDYGRGTHYEKPFRRSSNSFDNTNQLSNHFLNHSQRHVAPAPPPPSKNSWTLFARSSNGVNKTAPTIKPPAFVPLQKHSGQNYGTIKTSNRDKSAGGGYGAPPPPPPPMPAPPTPLGSVTSQIRLKTRD